MKVKRKFAMLSVVGALLALAIPGAAMAYLTPAAHKFEIAGNANGPKVGTSLGSCNLAKVLGETQTTTTKTPGLNPISSITVGSCTSGTSLTLGSSGWSLASSGIWSAIIINTNPETLTMRFSSLPGCKLTNSNPAVAVALRGVWSNGATTPTRANPVYTGMSSAPLYWANDGSSCALTGTTEQVAFTSSSTAAGVTQPAPASVNDLTNPSGLIVATP